MYLSSCDIFDKSSNKIEVIFLIVVTLQFYGIIVSALYLAIMFLSSKEKVLPPQACYKESVYERHIRRSRV